MLAAIVNVSHLVEVFGYPLLFGAVMAESSGVPVPGETGLITAAVLASQGKLEIGLVIPIAALAAIVGDNIGYQIGRKGGRWLLERPGRFHRQRRQVLALGEPFFERHGPKAVFFGRFLLGLRVWASWLAGATKMPWRSFVLWNALGGICWATGIGLLAYFLGSAAGNAISTFGLYGVLALLIAGVSVFVAHRRHQRRMREEFKQTQRMPEANAPPAPGDSTEPSAPPEPVEPVARRPRSGPEPPR
ncbi:MAG TPA: DedA family protein [Solirubrobacteraceae bacterium]|nr:DedA family protein [Solirubrobacteraceae bacterium]